MGHLVGKLYVPESLAGRTRSYCLEGDPVCAAGRDYMESLRTNLGRHTLYTSADGLRSEWVTQDGAIHAAETVFPMIQRGAGGPAPVVAGKATRTENQMVFVVLNFDAEGGAAGFGFRGANGSSWAEESHPFTDPSYGRVSPGKLEYPFNHGCGTAQQYESDVEAWLYDDAGRKSEPVTVHLLCN